ncbi:MAG: hypothetical protein NVS9B9_24180 [Ktedonobacteraceae bacterium]
MSEEEVVRSLDDQERVAALERNLPELERLWSDQFIVNAPNNAVAIGKQAVMQTFVHTMRKERNEPNVLRTAPHNNHMQPTATSERGFNSLVHNFC